MNEVELEVGAADQGQTQVRVRGRDQQLVQLVSQEGLARIVQEQVVILGEGDQLLEGGHTALLKGWVWITRNCLLKSCHVYQYLLLSNSCHLLKFFRF